MRASASLLSILVLTGAVAACAVTPPTGPSVAVMPGPSKTLAQFQDDDGACRQYAAQQTGFASPEAIHRDDTVAGAAIGTVAGAAAGAAIGAAAGNPAAGAAIGAGSGLVVGTAAGASHGYESSYQAQRAYDVSYQQCMVARGNTLPPAPTVVAPPVVYSYPAPYAPYYYYYPAPPPDIYWRGSVYWGGHPRPWH